MDLAVLFDGLNLPFPHKTFDLVYADYVMEHVKEPAKLLTEVYRVLKPGGSFFFRTPNLFHYVTLASALTPHRFHTLVANRMRGLPRSTHDPWPTIYLLNTRRAIYKAARQAGFGEVELEMVETEPSYLVFSKWAFFAGVLYERAVNSTPLLNVLRSNIFGRLTK